MTKSFDQLDLNLLRVFEAVKDERSVLRASQMLQRPADHEGVFTFDLAADGRE